MPSLATAVHGKQDSPRLSGARHLNELGASSLGEDREESNGNPSHDLNDDDVLDDKARSQYDKRQLELERAISHALGIGDKLEADRLQTEYDLIERELSKSRDIHGRTRRFPNDSEKARISVTKAIGYALGKIRAQAPGVATYLEAQIQTGIRVHVSRRLYDLESVGSRSSPSHTARHILSHICSC